MGGLLIVGGVGAITIAGAALERKFAKMERYELADTIRIGMDVALVTGMVVGLGWLALANPMWRFVFL